MLQHSPGRAVSKHVCLRDLSAKYQKSFAVCERCTLWFESKRFIETTPCQQLVIVGNLKLNRLSTQIKIYCLMTNETPALLVQRAP